MILSDRELRARLEDGSIGIDPLDDLEAQLQPASFDLRLGRTFRRLSERGDSGIELMAPCAELVLRPGDFALGTTYERVRVPPELAARVEGRSSFGRLGLLVHATAGFIDPGFEGEITLELANLGPRPVYLRPGSRVCQIVFHTMTSAAQRPYGPARGSKYSGQTGPTPSRLGEEEREV